MNRTALSLGLLVVVTLVWFAPVFPVIATKIVGDGGDNYQFLGFQFLGNRLLRGGEFPFGWTDYWRYPAGIHFQSATDSTLLTLAGLGLYPLLKDPVIVYNCSILLLLVLNATISYAAFRTWFDRFRSVIAAVIYGLSFYSLAKVGGHVNLLSTAGFPLFFAAVAGVERSKAAWRDVLLLAAASLYLAFASLQYPLILIGVLPFVVAPAMIFLPDYIRSLAGVVRLRFLRFFTAGVIVLGAFLLFHGRKLLDLWEGSLILPSTQLVNVALVNWIMPNRYVPAIPAIFPNATPSGIENSVFLGYVEMLLILLACRQAFKSRAGRFLVVATLATFVLALGLWPYPYLFRLTALRGVIEPARLFVLVYLGVTLLIANYLRPLRDRRLLGLVLLLVVVERMPWRVPLSPTLADDNLVRAVQSRPTAAILDLPIHSTWWRGQLYDLYSVHYRLPIVNGYLHWSGDYPKSRSVVDQMKEYSCYFRGDGAINGFDEGQAAVKRTRITEWMKASSVRTVVIHKRLLTARVECGAADRYIAALTAQPGWEILLDNADQQVLWLK